MSFNPPGYRDPAGGGQGIWRRVEVQPYGSQGYGPPLPNGTPYPTATWNGPYPGVNYQIPANEMNRDAYAPPQYFAPMQPMQPMQPGMMQPMQPGMMHPMQPMQPGMMHGFQYQHPGTSIPDVAESRSGRRKALLIGINYRGKDWALSGCVRDVQNLMHYLEVNHNFQPDEFYVLIDVPPSEVWTDGYHFKYHNLPTAENIVAGMRWLIAGAAAGDSLFFHYSGHGIQIPDANNDEIDGLDEAIVPCDYPDGDFVVDDVIKKLLVDSIPYGASGTLMDLPFSYRLGNWREEQPGAPKNLNAGFVVLYSSCHDSQTCVDTTQLSRVVSTGVMSYAIVDIMEKAKLKRESLSYLYVTAQDRRHVRPNHSGTTTVSADRILFSSNFNTSNGTVNYIPVSDST